MKARSEVNSGRPVARLRGGGTLEPQQTLRDVVSDPGKASLVATTHWNHEPDVLSASRRQSWALLCRQDVGSTIRFMGSLLWFLRMHWDHEPAGSVGRDVRSLAEPEPKERGSVSRSTLAAENARVLVSGQFSGEAAAEGAMSIAWLAPQPKRTAAFQAAAARMIPVAGDNPIPGSPTRCGQDGRGPENRRAKRRFRQILIHRTVGRDSGCIK